MWNVLNREMLLGAMEKPDKYPQLTNPCTGYAVRFPNSLTKEQQQDVVTAHHRIVLKHDKI